MSPQSRGRKPQQSRKNRKPTRKPDPFVALVRQFSKAAAEGGPLGAELYVSGFLGTVALDGGESGAGGDLVRALAAQQNASAAQMLSLIAYLAPSPELRELAGAHASSPPAPVSAIDSCWVGDVYGDEATVLVAFEQDGERHALVAYLDCTGPHPWVVDLAVTAEAVDVRRELKRSAFESGGREWFSELALDEARRLIEQGLAVPFEFADADPDNDLRELRAFAVARCRDLPGPAADPALASFTADERAALVEEFVRDSALPDADSARFWAGLLVDFGCDFDAGRPLRVGPGKLETCLLGPVGDGALDDERRTALPDVLRAWAEWAGARTGLPADAISDLVEDVDDVLAGIEYVEPGPIQAYLDDLGALSSAAEVSEVLARRMFAMPYVGTTIGDEDYPELDPGDPDERRLLIIGEHPDLHDDLADEDFDADAAGYSPHLHITVDEIVITQLWDDDPPQAWQAAKRLDSSGLDRLDVIHAIGAVLLESIFDAASAPDLLDVGEYVTRLDELGR